MKLLAVFVIFLIICIIYQEWCVNRIYQYIDHTLKREDSLNKNLQQKNQEIIERDKKISQQVDTIKTQKDSLSAQQVLTQKMTRENQQLQSLNTKKFARRRR